MPVGICRLQLIGHNYQRSFGFHRYWTVDDSKVSSEASMTKTTAVASHNKTIKFVLNEPVPEVQKSQIQEFVEYHGGPGIQQVALRTNDIVQCVSSLRQRGAELISVPATYYQEMRHKLRDAGMKVAEDIFLLEGLNILVGCDEWGCLLQTFTKPTSDRPTVFLEIIQRQDYEGFGAGKFQALFEAIEREQAEWRDL